MTAVQEPNTLSKVLSNDFNRRKLRRKTFSIRAYAQFLGLSPSTVHSLMSQKILGSPRLIGRIGKKIGLSDNEQRYFVCLSKMKISRDPKKRAEISREARMLDTRFNMLSEEEFALISKWYNYPVMELIKLKDASVDPVWIGRKLGITPREAEIALSTFQKLGVIEISESGQVIVNRDYIEIPSGVAFEPVRELHQTIIAKAKDAVTTQPKGTRSFSTTVVRFRKSDVEQVHEFVSKVRRDFCERFESGTGHDAVYSLNMNFFRLDSE